MYKETISLRQAICLIVMFALGSSVAMGGNSLAGQDSWVLPLLAMVMMIPLLLIHARTMKLFPETDLFSIMITLFGKVFGKVLIALITWYSLHIGSLVLGNFSDFLVLTALPETPELPLMIAMILVVSFLAGSGIATMGKWAVAVFAFVLSVIFLTILMGLKDMDFSNIMPFFEKSPMIFFKGAYQTLALPLADTALFLGVADAIKKQDSPYKLYAYAIPIISFIIMVVSIRNIAILGGEMVGTSLFSSYTSARIIDIGDFLSRIEGTISVNFVFTGITKTSLCLLVASKGMAKLFEIQDYKRILKPTSMLLLALSAIVNTSSMERFGFLEYFSYYIIPFLMLIPFLIWVVAEIRQKKQAAAQT